MSDKLVSSRGAPRGPVLPTTSTLASTSQASAISQSPAFPNDSSIASWINRGDETAQRDKDQGAGCKPDEDQGSINPNIQPGGYCGHCLGVYTGNKLEWPKNGPGSLTRFRSIEHL